MTSEEIVKIIQRATNEIGSAASDDTLFLVEKKYLGRQDGEVVRLLRGLKDLSPEKKRTLGPEIQQMKNDIEALVQRRRRYFEEQAHDAQSRFFDPTLPGISVNRGSAHPITQFLERAIDIFSKLGFEVVEEPEVDTEEYNFDLLNIPKDHPSRDMHDTFYVKSKGGDVLLRTHTTTVQNHAMKTRKPPVRIISLGRVFRHEATDASHETTFHQIDGFVIDEKISVAHLIGTAQAFFEEMFNKDRGSEKKIQTRLRPHFYPFVEPGMDIDMSCIFCDQKGCSVCKHSGWIEMLGSGMIHPKVLKNMRVDPRKYSGFAFGFGIDRMVMLYYGINDIRLLYSGDLRFLKQF